MDDLSTVLPKIRDTAKNIPVRATIRYGFSLPDKELKVLVALAKKEKLHGWFLVLPGAVEVRLEGRPEGIMRFQDHWSRSITPEDAHAFHISYDLAQGGLPSVKVFRNTKSLGAVLNQLTKQGRQGLRTEPKENKLKNAVAGLLTKIRGFVLRGQQDNATELQRILRSDIERFAKKFSVNPSFLLSLLEETKGLPPHTMRQRLVDKLQVHTDVNLDEFLHALSLPNISFRIADDAKVKKTGAISPSKSRIAAELASLYAALGPEEQAYIARAKFGSLLEMSITSAQLAAEKLKVDSRITERARAAANLATLRDMEIAIAAGLARQGMTIESLATAPHTRIQAALRSATKGPEHQEGGAPTSGSLIARWQRQAREIEKTLRLFDELQELVRVRTVIRTRWAGDPVDQTSPLPRGATVRLIVRYPSVQPSFADIHAPSISQLHSDELDRLLAMANAVGGEVAERLQAVKDEAGYIKMPMIEGSRNESVLASTSPNNTGKVEFFLQPEIIRAFQDKTPAVMRSATPTTAGATPATSISTGLSSSKTTTLTLEVDFDGDIDSRSVNIKYKSNPYNLTLNASRFILVPDITVIIPLIPVAPDCSSIDTSPPAGPVDLWPENFFPLLGTAISPNQMGGILSFQQEKDAIDAKLEELNTDGRFHQEWIERYALCGYPHALTQAHCVPDYPDVWCVSGIVDIIGGQLAWQRDVTPEFSFSQYFDDRPLRLGLVHNLGSAPILALGIKFPSHPLQHDGQDDLFHAMRQLRIKLRESRTLVQSLLEDHQTDESGQKLPPSVNRAELPREFCFTDLLQSAEGTVIRDPDGHNSCSPNFFYLLQRYSSDPMMLSQRLTQPVEHVAILYELDRVLSILDELGEWIDYHYLRQRTLNILWLLNEGNHYLSLGNYGLAEGSYENARKLLDKVLSHDIDTIADPRLPRAMGNYHLFRMMTVDDAFEPVERLSVVTARPLGYALLYPLVRDEKFRAFFHANARPQDFPILDGDFTSAPLEDALYYLRHFVIPICLGEIQLHLGEEDSHSYDTALQKFLEASDYVPADRSDSMASHFLWLRIARTYLLQGYAQYIDLYAASSADMSMARQTLNHVLENVYRPDWRVVISEHKMHEGTLKQNPLVLALRTEACSYIATIDAGLNPLGYQQSYIPGERFDSVLVDAFDAVTTLGAAERDYIDFRVNAEEAQLRTEQITIMVAEASASVQIAGDNRQREQDNFTSTVSLRDSKQNELQGAQEALRQFSQLAAVRSRNAFAAVLGAVPSGGGTIASYVQSTTSDAFQLSQLARQAQEIEDTLIMARQGAEAAQHSLEAARAQERLAQLKFDAAIEAQNFDRRRFFTYAWWYALANEMAEIARYRRRHALLHLFLSQQAHNFMTGQQIDKLKDVIAIRSPILADRIHNELIDLDRAHKDFYANLPPGTTYRGYENRGEGQLASVERVYLDQRACENYSVDPNQWETLKRNDGGKIEFELRLDQLDCAMKGEYLQLVEDVQVVGSFQSLQGPVSWRLTNSPYSIARIWDPANRVQTGMAHDWAQCQDLGYKVMIRPQRKLTVPFRGFMVSNDRFPYLGSPATPALGAFEYNGLAQKWTLEILKDSWSGIYELYVEFRYSSFYRSDLQDRLNDPLRGCSTRIQGGVVVLTLLDNFFSAGQPPLTPQDRIATRQFLVDDFCPEHRTDPTLLNLGILFVEKAGAPRFTDPIHFYLSCDQYADTSGTPIEVVADTMLVTEGQIAVSDANDLMLPNPLNIFGDRNTTDAAVTPWIRLLPGASGATFRLRINLAENPSFNFDQLDYVLMLFHYRYS